LAQAVSYIHIELKLQRDVIIQRNAKTQTITTGQT